jgi:hypothetical protein
MDDVRNRLDQDLKTAISRLGHLSGAAAIALDDPGQQVRSVSSPLPTLLINRPTERIEEEHEHLLHHRRRGRGARPPGMILRVPLGSGRSLRRHSQSTAGIGWAPLWNVLKRNAPAEKQALFAGTARRVYRLG